MLKGDSSIHQIKGAGFDALLLFFQVFPQDSAPFGNRQREGKDRNTPAECLQLGSRFLWMGTLYNSLVGFHVGDDADGNTLGGKPLKKLVCLRDVCEVVNEKIGVNKIGHTLVWTATAFLAALAGKIGQEYFPVYSLQCSGALFQCRFDTLWVVMCPDVPLVQVAVALSCCSCWHKHSHRFIRPSQFAGYLCRFNLFSDPY